MFTQEQLKARDELLSLQRIDGAIRRREKEIRHLRQDALRVSSSNLSGMPQDPSYAETIGKIDETERAVRGDIVRLGAERNRIIGAINRVSPVNAEILYRRYVNSQTVEKIAQEMHYSVRVIVKRHKDGLAEYAQVCTPRSHGS